jgi:superfamily I DNA and/or RNA helicase
VKNLKTINKELEKTKLLLELEKTEELFLFKQKISQTSFAERRKNGVLWYPVRIEQIKYDTAERLIVRVIRNKEHKESHLFQSGSSVNLFVNLSETASKSDFSVTGVVNQVYKQQMIITLNADDFPEWIDMDRIGVQLLFDENSYREMSKTMTKLIETDDDRINELKSIILGEKEAQFEQKIFLKNPHLNDKQNEALNKVLAAKDIAIVHGPPGTGKTTTLVNSVLYCLNDEKQVLVCAPSNAAVDLLVEKLTENGLNVVRIGHPARVNNASLSHTIDYLITQHSDYKTLKKIRKQSAEYFRQAKKYKRHYGTEERRERKLLFEQAHKLKDESEQLIFFIKNDILQKAQVIATTLVGANSKELKTKKFSTVFIDEAAQGLEPAVWIPIIKSNRVIFAGDHKQLPPTIKSKKAAKDGLEHTLFEKAVKNNPKSTIMLEEQYRMNEQIMKFPGQYFYKDKLFANELVAKHKVFETDKPVEFIDTAGLGFIEKIDEETQSRFNPEEAELLFKYLADYLYLIEKNNAIDNFKNLAIISPYRAQVRLLQYYFEENFIIPEDFQSKISVDTIDSFQGQERDVIFISLVRSNQQGSIGFLTDIRRMNVAMTRARKKLVVVGNSETICQNEFYDKFLDYANKIGVYKSAYEIIY